MRVALALLLLLSGCDRLSGGSVVGTKGTNGQEPSPGWGKARLVEAGSDALAGRFQLVPAPGEMPAVLLDTATGCMEFVEKWTVQQAKPELGTKNVLWIRRQSDEVAEGTAKRCSPVIRYVRDKDGKLVRAK